MSLCPCVIYQECSSLREQFKEAFNNYISCRQTEHCGEIIPLDFIDSDCRSDNEVDNQRVACPIQSATCRCNELRSKLAATSSTTSPSLPRQWLIPGLLLNEILLPHENAADFLVIAFYDISQSLLFAPSPLSIVNNLASTVTGDSSCVSSHTSFAVVVKLSEFAKHLCQASSIGKLVSLHRTKNEDNNNSDDDDDQQHLQIENVLTQFLERKMIPGLFRGLIKHLFSSSHKTGDQDRSPFSELITSVAPASDASLSPSHAQLPGGRFECYGPSLLWQVVCFLTPCCYSSSAFSSASEIKSFTMNVLRNSEPLGMLHDEDQLLQESLEHFATCSLPALSKLLDEDAINDDEIAKWFDTILHRSLALLLFLNCRLTTGSTTASSRGVLPRPPHELVQAFTQRHALDQLFSVGARALAKHNHRDESANWWNQGTGGATVLKGSQAEKNRAALIVLYRKILGDIHWCNVHMLPHDIVTMEVRCSAGYGARWVAASSSATTTAAAVTAEPGKNSGNETKVESKNGDNDNDAGDDDDDQSREKIIRLHSPCPFLSLEKRGFFVVRNELIDHQPNTYQQNLRRTTEFRGFLEPHEEDGHAKGWKH